MNIAVSQSRPTQQAKQKFKISFSEKYVSQQCNCDFCVKSYTYWK